MSALALAVFLGYLLGRVRPLWRVHEAAWSRGVFYTRPPSRFADAWAVLWLALNPLVLGDAYRIWRKRRLAS